VIEKKGLVHRVKHTVGPYLSRRLRETFEAHPLVGEVRCVGLLAAIELVSDKTERKFFPPTAGVGTRCRDYCFKAGLVMRAIRDTMVLSPPLTITETEIEEIVGKAKDAIDSTARDYGKM
jgi:putrescine---pyruvate transaminase